MIAWSCQERGETETEREREREREREAALVLSDPIASQLATPTFQRIIRGKQTQRVPFEISFMVIETAKRMALGTHTHTHTPRERGGYSSTLAGSWEGFSLTFCSMSFRIRLSFIRALNTSFPYFAGSERY
jgi:hypothetical protein